MFGLSVSGGGALGIGPAYYLSLAEADGIDWQSKVSFYAGTSTGSIIASALAFGYTGDEVYDLYKNNIDKIFSKYPWYKRLFNRRLPKYDNEYLKYILDCVFGETTIDQLDKKLYVPAFITDRDNADKIFDNGDHLTLKYIVASSCSAPTYFTPNGTRKNLCDGGLFANDPIAVLASSMKQEQAYNPKIISFVTSCSAPDDLSCCGDRSLVEWLLFILDKVVARTGAYNKHLAEQLVGKQNILRLSPMIQEYRKMDDTSETNIRNVLTTWEYYYRDTKDMFRSFVESN